MEDEDFLEGMEAAERSDTDTVQQEVQQEVAPVEVAAEAEKPAEVVEEPKPEPQFIPITALLDERDKRKALEQELARYAEQAKPREVPQAPDMFEDPEGYTAYQHQLHSQAVMNNKLDISEEMARDKFGDEKVDATRDWALKAFATRPGFQQEVLSQRHPWKYAVETYEREQIASSVTADDYAQFQAWKAAQTAIQPAPTSRQTPPKSLASAPSAGGISTEVAPTDTEIFADTFDKR